MTGEPNKLYDTVNVQGTERLLRALSDFEVEQFIYASTMLVHAPTESSRLIALSLPRGAVHSHYGDWDRLIR